jgi:hypothetical protein
MPRRLGAKKYPKTFEHITRDRFFKIFSQKSGEKIGVFYSSYLHTACLLQDWITTLLF